jgi:hypothetical protein
MDETFVPLCSQQKVNRIARFINSPVQVLPFTVDFDVGASARQHFALPRHQMNAACHRAILKERFATWHDWVVSTSA